MAEFRISTFENGFVLYFETPETRINAYALASTLVALSDAAKAANRKLNSAFDIEIVVEALGGGSFRARIAAIAKVAGIFVAQQVVLPTVLGVVASYIYERNFAKKDAVKVVIETSEVIVKDGDNQIIIPREVYEATEQVSRDSTFVRSMDKMFDSVILDESVTGLGIAQDMQSPKPSVIVPRQLLAIKGEQLEPEPPTRIIEEDADLYIVKAIMERSTRKWEFKWHGMTISAPIKDSNFYDDFARHDFTIAPGDEFQARLMIHQKRDDISGIYTNTSYEVTQVYRHISRPRPKNLPLSM